MLQLPDLATPQEMIDVYNRVVELTINKLADRELGKLNWPIPEFAETDELLPSLGWNSSLKLGRIRSALQSLRMEDLPEGLQHVVAFSKEVIQQHNNSGLPPTGEVLSSFLEGILQTVKGGAFKLAQGLEINFYPLGNQILRALERSVKATTTDKPSLIQWQIILPQLMYFILSSPLLLDLDSSGTPTTTTFVSSYDISAHGPVRGGDFTKEEVFPDNLEVRKGIVMQLANEDFSHAEESLVVPLEESHKRTQNEESQSQLHSKKKQKRHPPTRFERYFESRLKQERENNAKFNKLLDDLQNETQQTSLLKTSFVNQKSFTPRVNRKMPSPQHGGGLTLTMIMEEIANARIHNKKLSQELSNLDV